MRSPTCRSAWHNLPACLLRCWALSFLSLPPYRGCELLEYQQLSCKGAWTDRNKLPEAKETATLVPLKLKASLLFHTHSRSDRNHIPQMDVPPTPDTHTSGVEGWHQGIAKRVFTKVAAWRPHQRKMKCQHRGKMQRKREIHAGLPPTPNSTSRRNSF